MKKIKNIKAKKHFVAEISTNQENLMQKLIFDAKRYGAMQLNFKLISLKP